MTEMAVSCGRMNSIAWCSPTIFLRIPALTSNVRSLAQAQVGSSTLLTCLELWTLYFPASPQKALHPEECG